MAGEQFTGSHRGAAGRGRLMSLVGGGLALVWGLRHRSLPGLLAGAAGGALLYRGMSNGGMGMGTAGRGVHIETSVVIDRSPEELYHFWHGFTRLPQFMRHLDEVSTRGPNLTHWVARAPVGPRVEWDAEVTADEPGERIAWRSVEGSTLMNEGEVRFIPTHSASGMQSTRLEVSMRFQPPGGIVGSVVGQLLSGMTKQEIDSDLRRFKRIMESSDTATETTMIQ